MYRSSDVWRARIIYTLIIIILARYYRQWGRLYNIIGLLIIYYCIDGRLIMIVGERYTESNATVHDRPKSFTMNKTLPRYYTCSLIMIIILGNNNNNITILCVDAVRCPEHIYYNAYTGNNRVGIVVM